MTTTTDFPASPLKDFLTGALHMTPLNLAVVPWAILAGSMAVDSGLTFAQSVAMSAMVFAGAAQLVTLGLLNSGAGVITIIVSVFFITSQHLLYGLTLRPHVRPFSPLQRAGIGFLLTDELFAVSVAGRQRLSFAYLFGAGLSFYLVWVLVSILGQNTVLLMQKWITRIFGAMTLFVVLWLLATADWQALISRPSGNWITGFLPAVSIIAAGTGISWAIAGADYSRDQSPSSSHSRIFGSVVGGAALPLLLLILTGILLTAQLPDLAAEENPIAAIGGLLPSWMAVPYLAAAVAGIVTIAVLSLYSASLNLLSMGIKLKQRTAVALDGVIVLAIAIYVLFVSGDFLGPFISFLVFCGLFLASWAAIFITDYYCKHKTAGYDEVSLYGDTGVIWPTFLCWLGGSVAGLLVTNTGFINGPFATGVFENSSLGLFVSFLVSMAAYRLTLMIKPVRS